MKRTAALVVLLAALVALPLVVPVSLVIVLSKVLIAGLFALAFNLLSGQAGMLSFGQAAYYAVGAFATLHVMQGVEAGWHFPTPLLPAAGALAGLVVGAFCGVFATLKQPTPGGQSVCLWRAMKTCNGNGTRPSRGRSRYQVQSTHSAKNKSRSGWSVK